MNIHGNFYAKLIEYDNKKHKNQRQNFPHARRFLCLFALFIIVSRPSNEKESPHIH